MGSGAPVRAAAHRPKALQQPPPPRGGIGGVFRDPPDSMTDLGKALIGLGLLLVIVGGLLLVSGRVPFLGRLPGDIHVQRGNWSFYFPLTTSILLSVVLSLVLMFLSRR